MTAHNYRPVRGKRVRVTTLDACGRVDGNSKYVVSKGLVTLTIAPEVEEGTEILQRNMAGELCINERTAASMKSMTIEAQFCGVEPSLAIAMTNARPYLDAAGDLAGFRVPEGAIDKTFALELWTGLSGQACGSGADEASGYLLLPFVLAGVPSEIAIDGENAVTFGMTGASTKPGNQWGVGPYDVVYDAGGNPAKLASAVSPDELQLVLDTGLAVPALQPDLTAVPGVSTTTTSTTP